MKKPSLGALLCGFVPFVAVCFSVSLWDRIDPIVFGLPFNFFWVIAWLVLTPICMWGAYRFETADKTEAPSGDHDHDGAA